MMKQNLIKSFCVLALMMLFGCETMERRSEQVPKKPLPEFVSKVIFKPVWSQTFGQGVKISDANLVLSGEEGTGVLADATGKIVAFSWENGRSLWERNLGKAVTAGPFVGGSRVFIASDLGDITALELSNGKIIWEKTVEAEVLALPQYHKDQLFIHSMNGSLVAFNAHSGNEEWRYATTPNPLMLRRASQPVVKDNLVLTGFSNGKIIALQKKDGSFEWERVVSAPKGRTDLQRMVDVSASPLILSDEVYVVGYHGKLLALNALDGDVRWEKPFSSFSGMAGLKNTIWATDVDGILWSFDRETGDVLWKQEALSGRSLTKPVLVGDYLLVSDQEGWIYCFNQADGDLLGKYQQDTHGIEAAPWVRGNVVYVLGNSGKVTAFKIHRDEKTNA